MSIGNPKSEDILLLNNSEPNTNTDTEPDPGSESSDDHLFTEIDEAAMYHLLAILPGSEAVILTSELYALGVPLDTDEEDLYTNYYFTNIFDISRQEAFRDWLYLYSYVNYGDETPEQKLRRFQNAAGSDPDMFNDLLFDDMRGIADYVLNDPSSADNEGDVINASLSIQGFLDGYEAAPEIDRERVENLNKIKSYLATWDPVRDEIALNTLQGKVSQLEQLGGNVLGVDISPLVTAFANHLSVMLARHDGLIETKRILAEIDFTLIPTLEEKRKFRILQFIRDNNLSDLFPPNYSQMSVAELSQYMMLNFADPAYIAEGIEGLGIRDPGTALFLSSANSTLELANFMGLWNQLVRPEIRDRVSFEEWDFFYGKYAELTVDSSADLSIVFAVGLFLAGFNPILGRGIDVIDALIAIRNGDRLSLALILLPNFLEGLASFGRTSLRILNGAPEAFRLGLLDKLPAGIRQKLEEMLEGIDRAIEEQRRANQARRLQPAYEGGYVDNPNVLHFSASQSGSRRVPRITSISNAIPSLANIVDTLDDNTLRQIDNILSGGETITDVNINHFLSLLNQDQFSWILNTMDAARLRELLTNPSYGNLYIIPSAQISPDQFISEWHYNSGRRIYADNGQNVRDIRAAVSRAGDLVDVDGKPLFDVSYRLPNVDGEHLHHMIAAVDSKSLAARQLLMDIGIHPNSVYNASAIDGAVHHSIHTQEYYDAIRDVLAFSDRDQAIVFLERLARHIDDLPSPSPARDAVSLAQDIVNFIKNYRHGGN